MTPDVRRVVVRAPNWLGDAVLALPAMVALRDHFATAAFTVAAPASVAPLFRQKTGVRPDDILVLPSSTRAAAKVVRDGAFDLAVLFPNSFGSAWLLRRAGVPQRWGRARRARGWLLTRRSQVSRGPARQHHSDYYRAMVRGFDIPCGDGPPSLAPSDQSRVSATSLLAKAGVSPDARLVGVAPGAAYGQAKQWPPARMAAVMARLVRDEDVTCVVVGAAHDRGAYREIESWLRSHAPETRSRVFDFTGRTDLGGLVGLASMCRVFVSNDSGAMHVAAALGRPVVAMFGPTDAGVTRPLGDSDVLTADVFCRPCHLRDCPIDHRCMKRIETDVVFEAVARYLAGTASDSVGAS